MKTKTRIHIMCWKKKKDINKLDALVWIILAKFAGSFGETKWNQNLACESKAAFNFE